MLSKIVVRKAGDIWQVIDPVTNTVLQDSTNEKFARDWANGFMDMFNTFMSQSNKSHTVSFNPGFVIGQSKALAMCLRYVKDTASKSHEYAG